MADRGSTQPDGGSAPPDTRPRPRPYAARLPGIGSHHSAHAITDDWLTPPALLAALGPFDLDPCAAHRPPWPTAQQMFSIVDDGLSHPWQGCVWLNPPYSEVDVWVHRLAVHGDGVALVFARTETRWWFDSIWPWASALLFLRGRLSFRLPNGDAPKANSGGPSVLAAYGPTATAKLQTCALPGHLLLLGQP